MNRWIAVAAGTVFAACGDATPTSTAETDLSATSARGSGGHDSDSDSDSDDRGRARVRFTTPLRASLEIPTSTSTSRGVARLTIPATGPIHSRISIDNRRNDQLEVLRFCHIHYVSPTATPPGTGPVVWWVTPIGVNLQLQSTRILIGQDATYAPDVFPSEGDARTALLRHPDRFYVNCHSNRFPAGFIRGNLPGHRSHH